MNAAARQINQSDFFHGHLANMKLSKNFYVHLALLGAILMTSLGIVYTTNMHRIVLGKLEQAQHQTHQLRLQSGQLLLEQASLVTPARVQQLAEQKLHMILPLNKQAYVLRAQ